MAEKKKKDAEKETPRSGEQSEQIPESAEERPEDDQDLGNRVKEAASFVAKGISFGAENVQSIVKRALHAREHVLMVRVNDETLERISDLKDAGLFRSRSEAAAYLIAEGIVAKQDLYDRIQEKIREMQKIKEELRMLADDAGDLPLPDDAESGKEE
jgi:hypothetical protein